MADEIREFIGVEPAMISRDRRLAFSRRRSAATDEIRRLWDEEMKYAQEACFRDVDAMQATAGGRP